MLAQDIERLLLKENGRLERENDLLRKMFQKLERKLERMKELEEKEDVNRCQYCKKYIQYYIKSGPWSKTEYTPINAGHCVAGVSVNKGGKKRPTPDDSCPYFELSI